MLRLLKDPLLHFLVLGGCLFAVSWMRGEEETRARIVVPAAEVERLRDAAALIHGRAPTRDELVELLEPTVRDEVLYREALALGLDVEDDEVRRRLIEKMAYLTFDLADPEPASAQQLRAYYERDPGRYALPERVTFEQVFFSPRVRGEAIGADVEAARRELEAGADPAAAGDRTPLQLRFDAADRERLEVLFGEALTDALFTLEPGRWAGPYRSDFGLHLTRVLEREPARLPLFDEVRDAVLAAYAADARARRNEAEYRRLRSRYEVAIEWPSARRGGDGALKRDRGRPLFPTTARRPPGAGGGRRGLAGAQG